MLEQVVVRVEGRAHRGHELRLSIFGISIDCLTSSSGCRIQFDSGGRTTPLPQGQSCFISMSISLSTLLPHGWTISELVGSRNARQWIDGFLSEWMEVFPPSPILRSDSEVGSPPTSWGPTLMLEVRARGYQEVRTSWNHDIIHHLYLLATKALPLHLDRVTLDSRVNRYQSLPAQSSRHCHSTNVAQPWWPVQVLSYCVIRKRFKTKKQAWHGGGPDRLCQKSKSSPSRSWTWQWAQCGGCRAAGPLDF